MEKLSCFVTTIDLALAEKLRGDLLEQGFSLKTPQYTLFSAQKEGVSCTLYTSGKLTVQGKGKDTFIEFYLEPQILGTFSYTHPADVADLDLSARIGIDEAGKGDFFGPLCIAGVQAGDETLRQLIAIGVRDSKSMSDQAVLKLAAKIKAHHPHAIVSISPSRYNELYPKFHNLNRLLAWGHATAIEELHKKTACPRVIIDQFASEHVVANAIKQKHLDLQVEQRHRGEEDHVVAAASILARAAFLEGLKKLEKEYGVLLPKGASSLVVQAAQKIVAQHGRELLSKLAKLHFKTLNDVLGVQ